VRGVVPREIAKSINRGVLYEETLLHVRGEARLEDGVEITDFQIENVVRYGKVGDTAGAKTNKYIDF
jgi:hypothetical protein